MILAQLTPMPTPTPIVTFAPTSERATIESGLDLATAHAQALGGTLGAVIIDIDSGVILDRNGDQSLPMASVQKLLVAIVTYGEIDKGALALDTIETVQKDDVVPNTSPIADAFADRQTYTIKELLSHMLLDSDNTAAKALTRVLGGIDVVNDDVRKLGYEHILAGANDDGEATPMAIARVFSDLANGQILQTKSRNALVDTLAGVESFPGRLRAGLPAGTRLAHKTGTMQENGVVTEVNDAGIVYVARRTMVVVAMLNGAKGTDAQRDAVLADVARAAAQAAAVLSP